MSTKLYNLARMTTATTGTGTITLASAVSGYLTFALAGIANGDIISYAINDGANSEIGTGTYTSAGTTLTRTVTKSTNSNTAISLSGTAQVFITPRAEDLSYYNNVTLQVNPTPPTGTTSAAGLMAGLGSTCTMTPLYTTRLSVNIWGNAHVSAVGSFVLTFKFGTGAAPANAAAITGTTVGTPVNGTSGGASFDVPFSFPVIITGLTPGTAYWFDLVQATNTGTVTISSVSCSGHEF